MSKTKRFLNWFKGKDRESPIPESPKAQRSTSPAAATSKRDDYSNDYRDDSNSDDSDSDVEEDTLSNHNQTNVQVKLVDLGGHTAMV